VAVIVADTDVLIDYLQGSPPASDRIARELEGGRLATTAVTRFELLAGARTARQEDVVRELLEALRCYPLDEDAADRAAAVRRSLEKDGQGIGMGDSLIAGITLARDAILLTRNVRHFQRVPDLTLGSLDD
jgi:tRNA(fMet)-specific endonuclease VapC